MITKFESKARPIDQMIDLINSFPFSITFFHWLAGDDLQIHTSYIKKKDASLERLGEYYVNDLRIFSGGGEFSLDSVSKKFLEIIDRGESHYHELIPEMSRLKKIKISETLNEDNYTVVSQFFNLNQPCGACWEIYHMKNLISVYEARKFGKTLTTS